MTEILDPVIRFKESKLVAKLNLTEDQLKEFLKTANYVCEKVVEHFGLEKEDLFEKTWKYTIVFPRQLCQYQIIEENKKNFGNKYPGLIAKFFDTHSLRVMNNYHEIENKKISLTEGEEVRKVLGLFQYSSN